MKANNTIIYMFAILIGVTAVLTALAPELQTKISYAITGGILVVVFFGYMLFVKSYRDRLKKYSGYLVGGVAMLGLLAYFLRP
jgi:hypothetical protein